MSSVVEVTPPQRIVCFKCNTAKNVEVIIIDSCNDEEFGMKRIERCWLTGEVVKEKNEVIPKENTLCKLLDWRAPKLQTINKEKRKRKKKHKQKVKGK